MGLLGGLFKGKSVKDVLKHVDLKEINEEIGYLELQEKKLEDERRELEKEAEKLFQDSIGKSEATKRINAIKIKNIRDRIADIDSYIWEIALELSALYKIQRLKTIALTKHGSRIIELILKYFSEEDLERWLVNQNLNEKHLIDKLKEIIRTREPDMAMELSDDITEILKLMDSVEKGERKIEDAVKDVTIKKEMDSE